MFGQSSAAVEARRFSFESYTVGSSWHFCGDLIVAMMVSAVCDLNTTIYNVELKRAADAARSCITEISHTSGLVAGSLMSIWTMSWVWESPAIRT